MGYNMSLFAVIETATNICDNTIILDEGSTWQPPEDHYIVNIDGLQVGIGFTYDPKTGQWTPPAPPQPTVDVNADGAPPSVIG